MGPVGDFFDFCFAVSFCFVVGALLVMLFVFFFESYHFFAEEPCIYNML